MLKMLTPVLAPTPAWATTRKYRDEGTCHRRGGVSPFAIRPLKAVSPASVLSLYKKAVLGASLVAQWLRICLPIQGTWVRALVREDPTCCGTTKPVHHNYWACALEPVSHNYWAHLPQLLSPCSTTREATAVRSPCTTTKSSPPALRN